MSAYICLECRKPKAADVFSGEGGATAGLMRAGFCVTAVDNDKNRLRYNPAPRTVCGDAIEFILTQGQQFAFKWASPTCTGYSRGTAAVPDRLAKYDRLIAVTREALNEIGGDYVIENVSDAAPELVEPQMLCGRMFGLSAIDTDGIPLVMDRHRVFESNFDIEPPAHPAHGDEWVAGAYGGARRDKYDAKYVRKGGYVPPDKTVIETLLGIDWMTVKGLYLSIPPVYAQHIGMRAMAQLEQVAA